MFIAHEPQMPSRQERRNVSDESMALLIWMSPSSTIGPQLFVSISNVSMRGFSPEFGIEAVHLDRADLTGAAARLVDLAVRVDLGVLGKNELGHSISQ